jgi:hypothetical protein
MKARKLASRAIALGLGLLLSGCAQDAKITVSRYALVYGVSIYNSSLGEGSDYFEFNLQDQTWETKNLTYSDNDAVDMYDLMTNQGWTAYKRVKGDGDTTTTTLPTKAQMKADLSTIAAEASADSTVLIYFSGHGASYKNTAYIIPYEGISDDSNLTADLSTWISPSDLSSMLSVLPTKNIIVIFDTCNSGGFVSSGSATDASPSDYSTMPSIDAFSTAMAKFGSLLESNAKASGEKSPIVISAAGSAESSYDGSGNGVFTGYLLKAATKGDDDDDGYVTTTEAYYYARERIKEWDSSLTSYDNYHDGVWPFLPHISGGARDLVLFTQ